METGEFDFLIVSEPLRTIFHIEVKRTCSRNTSDSAAKQLDRGLKLIQDSIQFPEKEKWNYVRLMYFGRNGQKHSIFCPECRKHVLGPSQDIWSEIQWAPLNGITLGPRETDSFNRLILLSEQTKCTLGRK